MPIALCTLELYLPHSRSLKDKRMIVKRAQDKLRARFNFSIAEIDHQDVWQRCTIGAVTISASHQTLERVVNQFIAESQRILGPDLIDYRVEYIE